ncbi:hypothetical protein DV711_02525 [Motiliproteus coralliicola]|uniref:Hemerythrin-like domain-containing protein n=1 Tax=Motiliproteus coralliicola TaxID=2283196 RepID=A0A369WTL5_9GAMM|nr:hemerythrin domain-containing protein [Motiliproteus coralliicola]RDE24483.1 hypothetical protein DV711_02525 [Motiliproteus coralliicola]
MKEIMTGLYQDHQHIGRLLTILQNKLATLELGSRPNFQLMSDVLDYLEDYGDGYHHPREDLLFGYIRHHHHECESLVNQADNEHQELARLTRALRESVDQVLLDAPFSLQDFCKRLARYIDTQRRHLSFEEQRLFPLIEQYMTMDNWQDFSEKAPYRHDPLEAENRSQNYQQLANALIEDLADG